jgi:hypothetical protein
MAGSVVEGEVRCDQIPQGTRFTWEWDVKVSGPARFAGPLVGWIGRHEERSIWTGLQRHLESKEGAS